MAPIREVMARLKRSRPFFTAVTAGIGFLLGAFARPSWQVAVEGAQALAGVVDYPAGNSFYVYHVKLWTVLNQLLAMLLKLGLSEDFLSIFVSGVITSLSYLAIGACVFAISRNAFCGIAAPLLMDFSPFRHVLEVNYPIAFSGMEHTYGVIGLAWSVLTIALVAGGWRTSAGFFLGLAPAIHPSLGVWCGIVVALALVWSGRPGDTVRGIWKGALAGAGLSAVSLLVQLAWMRPALPSIAPDVRERFVAAWIAYFDFHRRPVDLTLPGVRLSVAAVALGLYLILLLDDERDRVPKLLLKATVIAAVIALGGAAISLLPPSTVPAFVLTLMPTRVFLVANLLFASVLFGLLGRSGDVWTRATALVFVALLPFNSGWVSLYGMMAAGVSLAVWKSFARRKPGAVHVAAPRWINACAAFLVVGMAMKTVGGYAVSAGSSWQAFTNGKTAATVHAAAAEDGLLVIGQQCCYFTQLLTRRPLLVEANALDQIPYAPESAPAVNEALKAVYGVDILDPPESVRAPGMPLGLTPVTKPLWEARSAEEWSRLGATFGFTQVLTNAAWRLQLPEVARDSRQTLYAIPAATGNRE
jgi:hypothetical protein